MIQANPNKRLISRKNLASERGHDSTPDGVGTQRQSTVRRDRTETDSLPALVALARVLGRQAAAEAMASAPPIQATPGPEQTG